MSFKDAVSKLRPFLGEQYQDWIEIDFSGWGNSDDEVDKFARIKNAILEYNYMEITYSDNSQGDAVQTQAMRLYSSPVRTIKNQKITEYDYQKDGLHYVII